MADSGIPIIDFAPFYGSDGVAKASLVEEVGQACKGTGFFQLINHGIPLRLQKAVLKASAEFFSLPSDTKELYNKDIGGFNRGYERLRAQNFEKRTAGDLKEGYYFGVDLPENHPKVVTKTFGLGPNKYPQHVQDPAQFRKTIDTYFDSMRLLAENIVRILCQTLDIPDDWVSGFAHEPIAVLRLLHYPPQAPDASELERGIGAHTDFGAVTILLQDMIGGLQVWNREKHEWRDVEPTEDALVVNLGNLMMRWTNDKYLSNLHRVINKSGEERYSVPFFFSGSPDFLVKCFSPCEDVQDGAKYTPIRVGDWIAGRYADTYGTSEAKAMRELSVAEAKAGIV
ncbi:hypothetical protein RBB50_012876 [Rhinocladiella similis]